MSKMTNPFEAELYVIIDKRTGKEACSGVWSKEMALNKIEEFKERQKKGGRPDISKELVDNLDIKEYGHM